MKENKEEDLHMHSSQETLAWIEATTTKTEKNAIIADSKGRTTLKQKAR
jgi:hypothetical protein